MTRRFSAASISRRKSDTVPPMADTSTKVARVDSAMTWASDVLPVPAGPKRMTELNGVVLDGRAQPAALAHSLRLPDHLVERARPHAHRQRRHVPLPIIFHSSKQKYP